MNITHRLEVNPILTHIRELRNTFNKLVFINHLLLNTGKVIVVDNHVDDFESIPPSELDGLTLKLTLVNEVIPVLLDTNNPNNGIHLNTFLNSESSHLNLTIILDDVTFTYSNVTRATPRKYVTTNFIVARCLEYHPGINYEGVMEAIDHNHGSLLLRQTVELVGVKIASHIDADTGRLFLEDRNLGLRYDIDVINYNYHVYPIYGTNPISILNDIITPHICSMVIDLCVGR